MRIVDDQVFGIECGQLVSLHAQNVAAHHLARGLDVTGDDGLNDVIVLVDRFIHPPRYGLSEVANANQRVAQIVDQRLNPPIVQIFEEDRVEFVYELGESQVMTMTERLSRFL